MRKGRETAENRTSTDAHSASVANCPVLVQEVPAKKGPGNLTPNMI